MKNVLKLTILSFIAFSLGALNAVPRIYYHNQSKWPVFVVYSSSNPPLTGFKEVKPHSYIDLSALPGDHNGITLCRTSDLSTKGVMLRYHNMARQYSKEEAITFEMGSDNFWNDQRNEVIGAPIEEEWEMVER